MEIILVFALIFSILTNFVLISHFIPKTLASISSEIENTDDNLYFHPIPAWEDAADNFLNSLIPEEEVSSRIETSTSAWRNEKGIPQVVINQTIESKPLPKSGPLERPYGFV